MAMRRAVRRLAQSPVAPRERLQHWVNSLEDAAGLHEAHDRSHQLLQVLDESRKWSGVLLPIMLKVATVFRPGWTPSEDMNFIERWNPPDTFIEGFSVVGEVLLKHATGKLAIPAGEDESCVSDASRVALVSERNRFPGPLPEDTELVTGVRLRGVSGPVLVESVMAGDSSLLFDTAKRAKLMEERETESPLVVELSVFGLLCCPKEFQPGVRLEKPEDLQASLEKDAVKDSADATVADATVAANEAPEAKAPEAKDAKDATDAAKEAPEAGAEAEAGADAAKEAKPETVDVFFRADVSLECQFSLKGGLVGEFVASKITFQ